MISQVGPLSCCVVQARKAHTVSERVSASNKVVPIHIHTPYIGLCNPYHPCMVYLHLVDFYGKNVGKYPIHGSYGKLSLSMNLGDEA